MMAQRFHLQAFIECLSNAGFLVRAELSFGPPICMLWAAQSYAFDGPEHSFGEAALILSETGCSLLDLVDNFRC